MKPPLFSGTAAYKGFGLPEIMEWKPIVMLVSLALTGYSGLLFSEPSVAVVSRETIAVVQEVNPATTTPQEGKLATTEESKPSKNDTSTSTKLNPALQPVCACESTGSRFGTPRQYNADGTVLRGKINPNDIGMCQINTEPRNGHLEASISLGLDIFTTEGNIAYANWLYEQSGLTPWNWSRSCWDSSL